jgi:hypothetical protein
LPSFGKSIRCQQRFLYRPCNSVVLKIPAFSDNLGRHANTDVSQPSVYQ